MRPPPPPALAPPPTAAAHAGDAPVLHPHPHPHPHLHGGRHRPLARSACPPVPGYTGFVPRAREHFARPYAVTTAHALAEFALDCRDQLFITPKLAAVAEAANPRPASAQLLLPPPFKAPLPLSAADRDCARRALDAQSACAPLEEPHGRSRSRRVDVDAAAAVDSTAHLATMRRKQRRAAELLAQCEASASHLVPGFTGFIPRMRDRFGEQYQRAAAAALSVAKRAADEAAAAQAYSNSNSNSIISDLLPLAPPQAAAQAAEQAAAAAHHAGATAHMNMPIPGYTGFVPLAKYAHATTFAHSLAQSTAAASRGNSNSSIKNLEETPPIPGYKGFVPLYQMHGQRAFGPTSKECIREHRTIIREAAEARARALEPPTRPRSL